MPAEAGPCTRLLLDFDAMALTATVVRADVVLSDVDRGVYETLDLRLAKHPSETARYLVTRLLAYCLSFEEGITWSKGGLSSADEPAICVRDGAGVLRRWIDIGSPSAERMHRASKAADTVAIYTCADIGQLRREASTQRIHAVEKIEVFPLEVAFVDAIADRLDRSLRLTLTRNDGHLYAEMANFARDSKLVVASLVQT